MLVVLRRNKELAGRDFAVIFFQLDALSHSMQGFTASNAYNFRINVSCSIILLKACKSSFFRGWLTMCRLYVFTRFLNL